MTGCGWGSGPADTWIARVPPRSPGARSRGATPFNRSSGDPSVGPNPSLAPIETTPFYAVRLLPGSFGTFQGLTPDPCARVVGVTGGTVDGLYAVGSDQASVFGGHYPSGGINIGPAMVFGYLAGRDLAGISEPEVTRDDAVEVVRQRVREHG